MMIDYNDKKHYLCHDKDYFWMYVAMILALILFMDAFASYLGWSW